MVAVKGALKITATPDGGVRIECTSEGHTIAGDPPVLELSGQEWRQVQDLVRQDAKVASLMAEARDQQSDIEGITWTP